MKCTNEDLCHTDAGLKDILSQRVLTRASDLHVSLLAGLVKLIANCRSYWREPTSVCYYSRHTILLLGCAKTAREK